MNLILLHTIFEFWLNFTLQYKILERDNLGELGKLQENRQIFFSKIFFPKGRSVHCIAG